MNKSFKILIIFSLYLIFLNSCAKPTVVDVVMPKDKNLNCKELKDEYLEMKRFRKEAEDVKDVSSGKNITRHMFFWPALLRTLHNADEAIEAANKRGYHLIELMKGKKCENANKYYDEITKKTYLIYVSQEIIKLEKLRQKGVLTEEEFKKAKKKFLDQ